jgi:hypothetical protein
VPAPTTTYERKLSAEDADTRSILILKSRWRAFPPPMQEFTAVVAGQSFQTRVVAEDCSCVPPPHQHYHLEAGHFAHLLDFRRGARVSVERRGEAYHVANR